MARKRQVLIDQDEDIVYYEHSLTGKFVRVLVGVGTKMPDNSFIAADNQNYENIIIQEHDYDNLMAANGDKPAGVFRKDDLWACVDLWRSNALLERAVMNNKIEANLAESAVVQ